MGTIYTGPTASGEAVRILASAYALEELTEDSAPRPIVVGPADLDVPWIVAKVEEAYEAGFAVGVTNAEVSDAELLHELMLHEGRALPHPESGVTQVALAAVRKVERPDGQAHHSSHLLLPRVGAETARLIKPLPRRGGSAGRRLPRLVDAGAQDPSDHGTLRALQRIFSDSPELPTPPPPTATATETAESPQQSLLELAESYQLHAIQSDAYGDTVQTITSIWAARSFTNSVDLYYVLQEADYYLAFPVLVSHGFLYYLQNWTNSVAALIPSTLVSPTLIGPSPQTTLEATQSISGVSYNIGGSVGWNQTDGLNASISGGVTISNQKVTTIPPIDITNESDPSTAQTMWTYELTQIDQLPGRPQTLNLFSQWIWSVPFESYPIWWNDKLPFEARARFHALFQSPGVVNRATTDMTAEILASVPMPFGRTFELQPPAVTGVSPSCVDIGEPFTIQGTGLYPSLVEAVLIGGTSVSHDNVTAVSDTKIDVIAPDTTECHHEEGCAVAVRTTEGTSNTSFRVVIRDDCG